MCGQDLPTQSHRTRRVVCDDCLPGERKRLARERALVERAARDAHIDQLFELGLSAREIGADVGLSLARVSEIIREKAIEEEDAAAWRGAPEVESVEEQDAIAWAALERLGPEAIKTAVRVLNALSVQSGQEGSDLFESADHVRSVLEGALLAYRIDRKMIRPGQEEV